jgi:hypothetical protein
MENIYQFGAASEVADMLNSDPDVTQNDLHAALINAMTRISRLEKTLERAERAANHAANTASCLANGIQPD